MESRMDAMNVSRLISLYPERRAPRTLIKPTDRARTGGTRYPQGLPGNRPAISAEAIPTIEPMRMPVQSPLSGVPRSPTPTPTASPQPAPNSTSV